MFRGWLPIWVVFKIKETQSVGELWVGQKFIDWILLCFIWSYTQVACSRSITNTKRELNANKSLAIWNKFYLDNQKLDNWRLKYLAWTLQINPWSQPGKSLSRFDWPVKFVAQRERWKLLDFDSQSKQILPRQPEIGQLEVEVPCLDFEGTEEGGWQGEEM